MAEHPAETLRRASARLREAMKVATPPPWSVAFTDGEGPGVDGPASDGHMVAEMYPCADPRHKGRAKADATLAALLRNSAEALAGWLDAEAERAQMELSGLPGDRWCRRCGGIFGMSCECRDGALATARAILGEADHA